MRKALFTVETIDIWWKDVLDEFLLCSRTYRYIWSYQQKEGWWDRFLEYPDACPKVYEAVCQRSECLLLQSTQAWRLARGAWIKEIKNDNSKEPHPVWSWKVWWLWLHSGRVGDFQDLGDGEEDLLAVNVAPPLRGKHRSYITGRHCR